jgi:hypothetical protein
MNQEFKTKVQVLFDFKQNGYVIISIFILKVIVWG